MRRLPTTDCRVRLDTTCCAPSDFVRPTDQPCRGVVLGTARPSAFYARRRSRDAFISPALSSTPWRAEPRGCCSCRNGGARSCRYRDAADGPIEGVFDFVALGVRPVDAASVTRGVGCAGIRRWYRMDSKQRGEEGCRGVCRSSCHRVVVPWVEVSRTRRDVSSTSRWLMLMLTTVPRRGNKHWHAGGRSGGGGEETPFRPRVKPGVVP